MVGTSRRANNKGKEIMEEYGARSFTVGRIICQNGFESLRIVNDPAVTQEKVP